MEPIDVEPDALLDVELHAGKVAIDDQDAVFVTTSGGEEANGQCQDSSTGLIDTADAIREPKSSERATRRLPIYERRNDVHAVGDFCPVRVPMYKRAPPAASFSAGSASPEPVNVMLSPLVASWPTFDPAIAVF